MSRQAKLTAGPITAQLVRLCLPLLAANVLQQLYNIINSLVVTRHIGGDAFAALGVAESVMNLFIYVITGACMGASVLVDRFFGEQNFARLRQQLFVSGVLIGGATAAAVLLTLVFLRPLLLLIQTPPELMDYAMSYLRIILAGMLFTFAYNYLAATLRAIGDTRAALCFLLASLAYNLAAAWLLVARLELGIRGTALATASAQLLSALLCLVYIRKKLPFLRIQRDDMRMNGTLVRQTTSYAAVAALQQSSLYLGKLMIQSAVNGLGTAVISAFTATTRVENFSQAFGISGCESIAIFVAQNQGAKKYRRALSGFLRGSVMVVGIGFLFSLLLFFGGVLGGLDGGVDGGLIGVLDHIGELEAHRDHQDDEQAEGGQLSGQEPEPPPVKEHIQDIGQAGHGDQDFEGEKAGDGQQILFQIDSAEHHKKVGAQVGQLLRDGGGGVSGNEGDGRRGRRGGGGELQHSGLLFLQCGNGVLVKFRGGRDACQDKEGEEGGEQGEDQEQGVPAKFFLDHVGLLSWEVVGSWTGQLSRAGCPHPGWEGGSRCP